MKVKKSTPTVANVAKFKSQLGQYLRLVKTGDEVIVFDRKTPVAKLVPYQEEKPFKLETIKPTELFNGLREFVGKPIKGIKTNSLAILLEDRAKR